MMIDFHLPPEGFGLRLRSQPGLFFCAGGGTDVFSTPRVAYQKRSAAACRAAFASINHATSRGVASGFIR